MPILILGLVALAVFVVMGLMLFSATIAERRDRDRRVAAAGAGIPREEKPKARAAHA
jgi:hypothetical protein